MRLTFKRGPVAGVYTATGIRGEWAVEPCEDAKHGDRHKLLLFREAEKPRLFGFFFTPDDAENAAERYDARGN